jgi:OOP family OmpA-OmpF porin
MNYNAILQKIFAVAMIIDLVIICGGESAAQSTPGGFDINNVPVVKARLGTFPYFSLIEGYQVFKGLHSANEDVAFDRYEFNDGTKAITVEGRLKIITASGKGASTYEVLKTYESLVRSLGGVRVWEGRAQTAEREIGEKRHRRYTSSDDRMGVYVLRTPDKEVWVEAYTNAILNVYFLTIVEKKSLTVRATLLTAAAMKKELDSKGRVPLYINFDTDKADIKPEAKPAIDEILKLLKMDSAMKLMIEGHTDNNGTAEYNERLSAARAKSIAGFLTKVGIAASRLKTVGVGQKRPIDDNSTEEGRAKNRRVELVKMQ